MGEGITRGRGRSEEPGGLFSIILILLCWCCVPKPALAQGASITNALPQAIRSGAMAGPDGSNRPRAGGIIPSVESIIQIPTEATLKHIQRIQTLTIAWMSVEAVLSLWAAWTARSPALAGFGGDSAVELISAAIVLWRFRTLTSEHAEQRAARIAGGLLFALTFYVILASTMSLLGDIKPRPAT